MTKKDFTGDINFLYEMGNIRLIDRMWRRFHFQDSANVAEHHFRVFWIAIVIAANEPGEIDTGKVAKLCLLHDITESRVGEVDYISRQYVDRKEELAINDMLDSTSVEDEYLKLWHEYELRESIEAKIVKDADTLDVDFELAEQVSRGNTIGTRWTKDRQKVADTKLYTDTAKSIYEQLKGVSPLDWHTNSPQNRHNGGDWKPDPSKR
jgi:putative hydrolase of HD superfamily